MPAQQLNPYPDNIPTVIFQCVIHALVFQHGMFKKIQPKIQPDEQDKTVTTQSKAACKFIIELTGRFYDLDKWFYVLMHPPKLAHGLPHCVTKVTTHSPLPKQTQSAHHTKYVPI